MSIQLEAAEALLESRFAPIKNLAGHKYSEFLANTKNEYLAKIQTYNWLRKTVEDFGLADKYYSVLKEEERANED